MWGIYSLGMVVYSVEVWPLYSNQNESENEEGQVCTEDLCWDGSTRDPFDCSCPGEWDYPNAPNQQQDGTTCGEKYICADGITWSDPNFCDCPEDWQ